MKLSSYQLDLLTLARNKIQALNLIHRNRAVIADPYPDLRLLSVLSRIYVGSVNFELNDQHIKTAFSQFGTVRNVNLSMDFSTGRHKGYGFIDFETPEAAQLAVDSMNGSELGGRQLKLGRPNNFSAAVDAAKLNPPKTRLYVSNVNHNLTSKHIFDIFQPFGEITNCVLVSDKLTGQHKGYGFIEFLEKSACLTAIQAMNGFELGGQALRIGPAIVNGPIIATVSSNSSTLKPNVTLPPELVAKAKEIGLKWESETREDDSLDKQEEALTIKSSSQRQAIMQMLARPDDVQRVLRIENVCPLSELDDALESEFRVECQKFGKVEGLEVKAEDPVSIKITFSKSKEAKLAWETLDQRWFAGRKLKATIL